MLFHRNIDLEGTYKITMSSSLLGMSQLQYLQRMSIQTSNSDLRVYHLLRQITVLPQNSASNKEVLLAVLLSPLFHLSLFLSGIVQSAYISRVSGKSRFSSTALSFNWKHQGLSLGSSMYAACDLSQFYDSYLG